MPAGWLFAYDCLHDIGLVPAIWGCFCRVNEEDYMQETDWFGTDGLRGPVGVPPMNRPCMRALGLALGRLIALGGLDGRRLRARGGGRVLVGWDTRESGPALASALCAGLARARVKAVGLGVLPTPALSCMARHGRCRAGVMVSASHNPASDNGIKLFDNEGNKLELAVERQLQHMAQSELGNMASLSVIPAPARGLSPCHPCESRDPTGIQSEPDDSMPWRQTKAQTYTRLLKSLLPAGKPLQGLRIAVDCAHGAAYQLAPAVLRRLGAQVAVLADQPTGQNINQGVGSEHLGHVRGFVQGTSVDFGVALDGDADRAAFVDETGAGVSGDAVLLLLAADLKERGLLRGDALVTTVMSDMGLCRQLRSRGIAMERTPVGDRHVAARARELGLHFGGEPSGHILFLPHSAAGDGLMAALLLAFALQRSGRSLSELAARFRPTPRVLLSVPVASRLPLTRLPETDQLIRTIERALGDQGRILVRYSGTEAKGRILLEGEDQGHLQQLAMQVARVWQEELRRHSGATTREKPPTADSNRAPAQ
ncbi:MAG: phosphoglucosamine mutase [Myxococcota bacterium]